MSSAKLVALSGLAALAISGCASASKPEAGTIHPSGPISRGRVDDPRTARANHFKCMQQVHLPVVKVGSTGLQVGPVGSGPTIQFTPAPGVAQGLQIEGKVPDAEVIGSALLYPRAAPDGELKQIEDCLALGVSG